MRVDPGARLLFFLVLASVLIGLHWWGL